MRPSAAKQKILDIVCAYWQRGNTHPSTLQSKKEIQFSFGMYDGSGQWRPEDLASVEERGQVGMIINIVQGKIDSLSGVEIQSRYRSACRNDSGKPEDDQLAKALTHYLYYIQQNQKMPYRGSLKFRDMLICGIGWSDSYQKDGKFYYEHVNPYNVIPDPDDLSPQYSNMRFVARKRWMDPKMVVKMWPESSKYIDFSEYDTGQILYSPELLDRNSTYTSPGFQIYNQGRMLVCEVQYKVPKKAYTGIDYQGYYFETFDEEKAEQIAESKNEIEEIDSSRIMRALFLDQNTLLEHGPLNPDVPSLEDFTYIPCVWKRRFSTGIPYGLVDSMISLQRDLNIRVTKALYLANSCRVLIQGNLSVGEDANQISQKMKTSDPVIVVPKETTVDIRDNQSLAPVHLEFANQYLEFSQLVTGIYADLSGQQTNAQSGVAQKQRQLSSIRNNVFAFDNFSDMKLREANFYLQLIQGSGDENLLTQIMTPEEQSSIILNLTREIDGKKVISNDISTLPVSLYIEEVPDYASTFEENRAALENLLSNPRADIILGSKEIMEELGIRNAEKISTYFKEIMSQAQGIPSAGGAPAEASNDPSMLGQKQGLI